MQELMEQYRQFKEQADYYTKQADKIKAKLKKGFKECGVTKEEHDGYNYELYTQKRKTLDIPNIITLLESRDLTEYVEYTPTVSESVLMDLLKEGKLTQEELVNNIKIKEIECFKLTKIKGDK